MKPSQLVSTLRRIASNIERSKNPDRSLVAKDLKKTIALLLNDAINKNSAIVIIIDSWTNEAVKTNDTIGELKKRILNQINKGEEIIGVDGEVVTTANIDQQLKEAGGFISDAFGGFMVTDVEGTEGVGIGFSSADRDSFPFPWPVEDLNDFYGNGDPMVYDTANVAPGTVVKGIEKYIP